METITQVTVMEITPKEAEMIMKQREIEEKQKLVKEKSQEVCRLVAEIKELGGHVDAHRRGKNHYISTGFGNTLFAPEASIFGVEFSI